MELIILVKLQVSNPNIFATIISQKGNNPFGVLNCFSRTAYISVQLALASSKSVSYFKRTGVALDFCYF